MANLPSPIPRNLRARNLVALGFFLAGRGVMAILGLVLTALGVVGFAGLAVYLAHRGKDEALETLPILASSALAFGIGVLVAFAAATRAFRRDEDEGVRALLGAFGSGPGEYLVARVLGLSLVLATHVGGGTLLVGLVATALAHTRLAALHTLQASAAALAFALAFAFIFAPVALATLAARSRAGGYLALLIVLVGPELLPVFFGHVIAPRWLEVASIPGALSGLRTALAPVGVDPSLLGRSLAVLGAILAGALLVVRAELTRRHGSPARHRLESRAYP